MVKKQKLLWRRLKFLLNLPKSLPLGWRLIKDQRLPVQNKIFFLGISILYLIFPFDIVPDFPVLGQIDDFTIFMFLFNWFLNSVPKHILEEYGWQKD